METTARANAASETGEQYSLGRILGIWALAAVPMGILSWIIFPAASPDFNSDPLQFGVTRIVLLALGLVWLFVLSMIIVRREEGDLRWATVKRRLRLNAPRDPATGQPRARLWLWVVPFIVGVAVIELVLNTPLEKRLGVGISVSCGARRLQLRCDLRLARDPTAASGCLVVLGLGRGSGYIQHDLGGGVSLSGSVAAQDGRCVQTLELGGEQRTFWSLSRSRALGDT
jgi:hypothetical protein